MNLLLAINYKFFSRSAKELVHLVEMMDHDRVVDGYEIMVDCQNKMEMDYLLELAYLAKERDFLLQVHSSSYDDIEIQKKFLDAVAECALVTGKTINIVYHPVTMEEDGCESVALEKTNYLLSELLNYIYMKQYHLTLSLENLDQRFGVTRLTKEQIEPVLYNNHDLYYTYDLGHEFRNHGAITDLDPIEVERLNNVHLHRDEYYYKAHLPFQENDEDKEIWVKAIVYLKSLDYQKSVVLEYDFYLMEGSTYEEQLEDYIHHATFLKPYLS